MIQPSLRQNQAITESIVLACADAVSRPTGNGQCTGAAGQSQIASFVHQVISGDQGQLTAAYEPLADKTADPAVLGLVEHYLFKAILDRLADNFVLWVMDPGLRTAAGVLTFSCDEPLHLRYRETGFMDNHYKLGKSLGFWRPIVWCSALGLTTTRIEFPVPAAENSASFHFEIDAPKGVEIAEATLLAGRPVQPDPSLDHIRGGYPTVGLHVIEVPNGSLSRAHIDLQVVTRGWLMASMLSSWAVFALLLAFATHDSVLNKTGDLPTVVLLALAAGSRPHRTARCPWPGRAPAEMGTGAGHRRRCPATGGHDLHRRLNPAHPTHLPPALWTAVGAGAAIAVTLSAVCLTSWRRQREQKVVCSPWEQNRAREDVPKRPESFEEAENKYGYRKAAMRVDSAEGWHTDFLWDQQAEDELIASLSRQDSAYHAFITSMPDRETWIYAGSGA